MMLLDFHAFSFSYPEATKLTLSDITFTLDEGDFVVVCGPTGSGKTTLLRSLKPELNPFGTYEGQRFFKGTSLDEMAPQESARSIGFVMQRPASQLVTDTVWHELAFGLENLGVPTQEMRRRIGETAQFFGIQTWFNKKVTELSGGQKQILNLASVMVMQPDMLVLDEPTSQLDPIAAKEFLTLLQRINLELGCTIVIAEHRLEEVLNMCNKVLFMQSGTLCLNDTPQEFAHFGMHHALHYQAYLPTSVRTSALIEDAPASYAFDIKTAREQLLSVRANDVATPHNAIGDRSPSMPSKQSRHAQPIEPTKLTEPAERKGDERIVLSARDLWVRYEKKDEPVLKNLNFALEQGSIHAIVGGNGSGKTTLLHALAGGIKPLRGSVTTHREERRGLLSQDPQTMFVKDSVFDELMEVAMHVPHPEHVVEQQLKRFSLGALAQRHPYDLSGGEMQKVALAKLMIVDPSIVLLDEPTKGLDAHAKHECGELLKSLQEQHKTICLVSHDLDFVAQYADVCSLLFNGEILATAPARSFFEHNTFYTTSTYRITRGILSHCIVFDDMAAALHARAHNAPADTFRGVADAH